jgi:hypothetical protein
MKNALLLLLTLPLLAYQCNKDVVYTEPVNFQPVKAGSSWTYDTKNNISSATGSFTLTATSKDSSFNGRTYRVVSSTAGANVYFAKSGSDYYQLANFEALNQQLELLYLKDGLSVGTSWDQNISVNIPAIGSTTVKLTNTVVANLNSYTVNGKIYSNVIQIKTVMGNITIPGLPLAITPVTDINSYYAAGIGRIYNRSKVNIVIPTQPTINTDDETSLRTYTIIP